jgi:hypothetical protein
MREARRQFLVSASAVLSGAVCAEVLLGQVPKREMPKPPPPAVKDQQPQEPAAATVSQRTVLMQHETAFRESLASLSDRVNQLKADVESIHTSEIFSVKIYKQTIEIERLAKQLKSLAKN